MGKWAAFYILLLHACLFGKTAATSNETNFFDTFFLEDSLVKAQCDLMQLKAAERDSAMVIDRIPKLEGKWVSEDCEETPGHKFQLRSYSFKNDSSADGSVMEFSFLHHFYEDDSCTRPHLTIEIKGKLNPCVPYLFNSWGTEYEYHFRRVSVVPYTEQSIQHLKGTMKGYCYCPHWKIHHESFLHDEFIYKKPMKRGGNCVTLFFEKFEILAEELSLIRTQSRLTEKGKKNRELVLGFAQPLLKIDQAHSCFNCHKISKGKPDAPPRLHPKPSLPPLPHGQWISRRCELHASSKSFSTMKISFDSRRRTWKGQIKFYSDPSCTRPVGFFFNPFASGTYVLGPIQRRKEIEKKRKTGTSIVLKIEDLSIMTSEGGFMGKRCGRYFGVPMDRSDCSGGEVLGTVHGLIKLEMDNEGTPLLYMGLQKRSPKNRDESLSILYEAPLIQCSVFPQ